MIAGKLVRQRHFSSCRLWEDPQIQTPITSRREAESSEYHLAAPNGLEPIQDPAAWRTAGQEEIGTANIQERHPGGAGEGLK